MPDYPSADVANSLDQQSKPIQVFLPEELMFAARLQSVRRALKSYPCLYFTNRMYLAFKDY